MAALHAPRISRSLLAAAFALAVQACGGAEKPVTPPPPEVPVASVVVSGAPTGNFFAGDSVALTAIAFSSSGNALANRTFEWMSSAPGIASVSSTGRVRALREGSVLITATVSGKSATALFDIALGGEIGAAGGVIRNLDSSFVMSLPQNTFVSPRQVVVRLVSDSLGDARTVAGTIFSVGPDSLPFGALALLKLKYDQARVPGTLAQESLQLHFRSATGWAPTFNSTLDRAARQVTGTVLQPGIYAVRSTPVIRVAISGASANGGVYSGQTSTLTADLFDGASFRLPARRVQWSSSSPGIVSVDSLGRLLAGALGTATITASTDGVSATTSVTSIVSQISDFSAAAEWTTFQGTFLHSGYVAASVSPERLRELWVKTPLVGAGLRQATIGGNRVFLSVQTVDGGQRLLALNTSDGAVLWSRDLGQNYSASQATWQNGRIYVTTSSAGGASALLALTESDGSVIYRSTFTASDATWEAPAIAGTTIAVAAGPDGGMYGFDIPTGTQRFFRPGSAADTPWAPTVYEGKFYTSDGGVQAIDPTNGTLISEFVDSRLSPATLVGANGPLMAGVANGRVFNVNLFNSSVTLAQDGGYTGVPIVTSWIFSFIADRVEAFSFFGTPRLTYTTASTCAAEPRSMIVTYNLLFVSCASVGDPTTGVTVAVDLGSKLTVWSYPLGGQLSLSGQGVLYITNGATVAALAAK